jgi:DNA-binding PadR family transcriptional regulator
MDERSNGFYSPSPGVIYPTLTFLEEAGHATSSAEGNKNIYAMTDAVAHLMKIARPRFSFSPA